MKTQKRSLYFISLVCLASLLLSACGSMQPASAAAPTQAPAVEAKEASVVAEGRLVPRQKLELSFAASGRVQEILAAKGDQVQAGQVLARLEGSQAALAELASAKLEATLANQDLKKLQDDSLLALTLASNDLEKMVKAYDDARQAWNGKISGDEPTAFETALKDYVDDEADVRSAQKEVENTSDLDKDAPARTRANEKLIQEQEKRQTSYQKLLAHFEQPREGKTGDPRTKLALSIAQLETARLRLKKLNGGPDPDLLNAAQARLERAQAMQNAAGEAQKALEIRAPFSGSLTSWDIKTGQIATPGLVAGSLADLSGWKIETTDLTENGVVNIQEGDPVTVKFDALPGESFTGQVDEISAFGAKHLGDMTYQVIISLDKKDPRWRWNMTAKVTIRTRP